MMRRSKTTGVVLAATLAGTGFLGACTGESAPSATQDSGRDLDAARAAIASRYECEITSVSTGETGRVTVKLNLGQTAAGQAAAKEFENDPTIMWESPTINAWSIETDEDGVTRRTSHIDLKNNGTTPSDQQEVTAVLIPSADTRSGEQAVVYAYSYAETIDVDAEKFSIASAGDYCGTIVARATLGQPSTLSWEIDPTAPPQEDVFRTNACDLVSVKPNQYTIPC